MSLREQLAAIIGKLAPELARHAENKADTDPYAAKFGAFARAVPERGVKGAWALVYSDAAPEPEGEA